MRGRVVLFAGIGAGALLVIVLPYDVVDESLKIQFVLFLVSVEIALVGIYLGIDSRRVLIKRHDAINKHERPYVIAALEVLFVDMEQTKAVAKKVYFGSTGTVSDHRSVYARIDKHVGVERQIALRFLEVGLSEVHGGLDPAFRALGEIDAVGAAVDKDVISKLDDAMSAVVLAIDRIKGIPPL